MSSIVFYRHKLPRFHSMRRERADGKGHSQAQDEQLLNLVPPEKAGHEAVLDPNYKSNEGGLSGL